MWTNPQYPAMYPVQKILYPVQKLIDVKCCVKHPIGNLKIHHNGVTSEDHILIWNRICVTIWWPFQNLQCGIILYWPIYTCLIGAYICVRIVDVLVPGEEQDMGNWIYKIEKNPKSRSNVMSVNVKKYCNVIYTCLIISYIYIGIVDILVPGEG